jgi:hypothetical protein
MDAPLGALGGAAGGMADAVSGIIEQRLRQAQVANQVQENQARTAQAQAQLAETTRAHMADEAARTANTQAINQWHQDTAAEAARKDREAAANQAGTQFDKFAEQAAPGGFYTADNPNVQYAQRTGRTDVFTPQAATPDQPMVGPLEPGQADRPTVPGTGKPAGFLKTATAKQQQDAATNQRLIDAANTSADTRNWLAAIAQQKADAGPPESFTAPVAELDTQGKPTGRYFSVDRRTNQWTQPGGAGPTATKTAPGQAELNTRAADQTEATRTLNLLDKSIDDASSMIGPGEGRVSNIEQMIGNQDPKIQRLGVFMKAAKMKIDGLMGSRRAAASPYLMKQWDNLLANNITPEGLKSAVEAMREVVGGAGVSGPGAGGGGKPRTVYDEQGNIIPNKPNP